MRVERATFVLAIALLALPHLQLHADDASKRAKIHEMFTLLQLPKLMEQMINQSSERGAKTAMSMFPNAKFTDQQKAVLDTSLGRMTDVLKDGLAWSKMEPEFTKLYADNYSEETIDGLLVFYRSPLGRELIAKQPVLLAQSNEVVQRASVAMAPQLQQVMKEMAEDMQKATPRAK